MSTNKVTGKKRARQQATEMEKPEYVHAQGDYNIWYHKRLGDKPVKSQEVSSTRCDPEKDSGLTKADTLPGKHFLCLYFARGKCVHGHNCQYYHRLPLQSDEESLPLTHDIFGRERHQTDREDMGGVGNFNRDNRTLYVGGIRTAPGLNLDRIIYEQFSVWGEIEYVRVIPSKMIAFVRYKLRTAAEFAKEAMGDQTLGLGDLLNIRWSNEDPNPVAKRYEEEAIARTAATAILAKSKEQGVPEYLLEQAPSLDKPIVHPYIAGKNRYNTFVPESNNPTQNKALTAPAADTAGSAPADLSAQQQYFLQWAQFFAQQGIDPSQLDEQTILYYQQYYTYQYSMLPYYQQSTLPGVAPFPGYQPPVTTTGGEKKQKVESDSGNNDNQSDDKSSGVQKGESEADTPQNSEQSNNNDSSVPQEKEDPADKE